MILLITLLCFLCGSLMFSYWIGLMLKINIRSIGDSNPGAANLWSAAGYKFGLLGVILDFSKGYIPLYFVTANELVSGPALIPVALAPIFGHAFSPFLKFNGGKTVAVSFGVWSALTQFQASLYLAVILAILFVLLKMIKKGGKTTSGEDGLQTTTGFLLLSAYLMYEGYPTFMLWIWFGNSLLMLWKNWDGIYQVVRDKIKGKVPYV